MRAGEGLDRSEFVQDCRKHSIYVFADIGVANADYLKPELLKLASALLVMRALLARRMRAAVNFDNELAVERNEIDDVACNRILAAELPSSKLTPAQSLPKKIFGCGLIGSQRARARLETVHPLTRLARCARPADLSHWER